MPFKNQVNEIDNAENPSPTNDYEKDENNDVNGAFRF